MTDQNTNNTQQDNYQQNTYQQTNYQQTTYQQPAYQQATYQQATYQQPSQLDYTPISMWGYFGYELLFSIPCIGFICLLLFSFGATKNVNLRNFARSYFCFLIIVAVLAAVLVFTGLLASF